jgi:hypothetical protein
METSKLENLNPKILKNLISILYNSFYELDVENPKYHDLENNNVIKSIEYAFKLMGQGEGEYIDLDFAFSLYKMNYHLIVDGKIKGDIIIPKVGTYEFEVEVDETIFRTNTYSHRVDSYSSDNVIPISKKIEGDGNLSIYDGKLVYEEDYDGRVNDVTWLSNSNKLIK